MRTTTDAKQVHIATELQKILGENYEVRYDDCESGLTRIFFKPLNIMTAEVLNSEMHTGISFTEYEAKREDIFKARALGLL